MSFIIGHKPAHLVCEIATGRSSAIFASTCQREDPPFSGLSHTTTNVLGFNLGKKNKKHQIILARYFFVHCYSWWPRAVTE